MVRKHIPAKFQRGGQSYAMWNVNSGEVAPRWIRDLDGNKTLVGGEYNGHPVDYVPLDKDVTATASNMMTDNLVSHWRGNDENTLYDPRFVADWYRNPTDANGNYVPFEMPLERTYPEFDVLLGSGLVKDAYKVGKHFRNIKKGVKGYTGVPPFYRQARDANGRMVHTTDPDDLYNAFKSYDGPIYTTDNENVARSFANFGGGHEITTIRPSRLGKDLGEVYQVIYSRPKGSKGLAKAPELPEGLYYTDRQMPLRVNVNTGEIALNPKLETIPVGPGGRSKGYIKQMSKLHKNPYMETVHPKSDVLLDDLHGSFDDNYAILKEYRTRYPNNKIDLASANGKMQIVDRGPKLEPGWDYAPRTYNFPELLEKSGMSGVEFPSMLDGHAIKPGTNIEPLRIGINGATVEEPMTERIYFHGHKTPGLYTARLGRSPLGIAWDYSGLSPKKLGADASVLLANPDRYKACGGKLRR